MTRDNVTMNATQERHLEKRGRVAVDVWMIRKVDGGFSVKGAGQEQSFASLEDVKAFLGTKYWVL